MAAHNFTYLFIDMGCLVIPLLSSFHPSIRFYKHWRFALPALVITASIFIVWDIIFTCHHIWWFNDYYVLGYYLFHLPLEEWVFFFTIPYACLFVYYCIGLLKNTLLKSKWPKAVATLLMLLLSIIALSNLNKTYTSVTFLSLTAVLFYARTWRVNMLQAFLSSYTVSLVPFFLANGMLTGTGLSAPVVFYNNAQNLSLRFMTIPVEDFFYGMTFQLINVLLYEYLTTTHTRSRSQASLVG